MHFSPHVLAGFFIDMIQTPFNLTSEIGLQNPIQADDGIVEEHDPLALEIEDKELVKVLSKRIETSKKFFNDVYELDSRREKNEIYLFGRQIAKNEKLNKYRPYEAKYLDNAIYEIEASIKPVAVGKLPDMIVIPGNDDPGSQSTADNLSLIIDDDLKKKENRRVLSLAFKHVPVYFVGIIKVRWNPEKGEYGDYEFDVRNPQNIVVDEQCATNNADDMKFIAEAMKLTVQEVIMRFPNKEEEFRKELVKDGVISGKDGDEWKNMATTIKIWEVWFTWYDKKSDQKYERIEGVLWKYGDLILKKMKNPNFDYEGEEKYFTYDIPGDKQTRKEVTTEAMANLALQGVLPPNMQKDVVFRNYFDMPHKPYFFMAYDQWGKIVYDETSRIEQNIRNQENLDMIGKRVIEKLKNNGKHVISKESGMTGKDMERTDFNNPDQDLLVDGDTRRVHTFIDPLMPTQQEFAELKLSRERMFSLAGATNLNGIMQSDVATTNQIARETNFTRVDDLTEETINNASEWMCQWAMQMIKLRYTEEHMRKILGAKGTITFVRLKSDMIEDGMEIKIKSSATDKVKNQNNAMLMAKMGMIDPLQFCKDMGLSNPEGRAEQMMMFKMDPEGYFVKYIMKKSPEKLAGAMVNQQTLPQVQNQPQPQEPTPAGGPQLPSPQNTAQAPIQPPTGVQGAV